MLNELEQALNQIDPAREADNTDITTEQAEQFTNALFMACI